MRANVAPQAPQPPNVPDAPDVPQPTVYPDVNGNGSQSSAEPCATLAEWLHNSLPPSQDLGVSFSGHGSPDL